MKHRSSTVAQMNTGKVRELKQLIEKGIDELVSGADGGGKDGLMCIKKN